MTGNSNTPVLTEHEFALFQKFIYETAGINLSTAKKALVSGRLAKRVKHHGLSSYGDYFKLLQSDVNGELQTAVDLLTTNETYFFREPRHFDLLKDQILPSWNGGQRRIWSAASSSGEEAYTLAMVMAEHSTAGSWEILGTDICTQVLERAQTGQYPMQRANNIPRHYLHKYCLRGIGSQDGTFIISRDLRRRVDFIHANLKTDLSKLGSFDVILLRNVLIYFDIPTKQEVISRVVRQLKPGGHLMVGHSESLNGLNNEVRPIAPSVYRKPC